MKMRTKKEIYKEVKIAEGKVWYDRHQLAMQKIYPKVLKKNSKSEEAGFIKGGVEAAKEMEKQYGKKNLGPYTEMDWGMLNGRLETLRWILGDDWGNLDT